MQEQKVPSSISPQGFLNFLLKVILAHSPKPPTPRLQTPDPKPPASKIPNLYPRLGAKAF